ncbi:MAG: YcxB family protein [Puniceicoccales bacterium]
MTAANSASGVDEGGGPDPGSVELRYEMTPELQKRAVNEIFFNVILGRKWMGVAGFAIASVICLGFVEEIPWVFPAVVLGLTIYLLFVWIRGYVLLRKDSLRALGGKDRLEHLLVLDEESLTVRVGEGARHTPWAEISDLVETAHFDILISGKIPVVCIPKEGLDHEARESILERIDR